jgi:single-strand DNA-binding protein
LPHGEWKDDGMADSTTDEGGNQVEVRGRLSIDPVDRELPSGTPIVSFRLVIPRTTTVMTRGSTQRSDWIDCTAWSAAARRRASGWRVGDTVEVVGALRRRHYRAGEVGGSRVEIEMLGGRLVVRAEAPAKRTRGRAPAQTG